MNVLFDGIDGRLGVVAGLLLLVVGAGHCEGAVARSRGISWTNVSQRNLKVIVTAWRVKGLNNDGGIVEAEEIRSEIPPMLDARKHQADFVAMLEWEDRLRTCARGLGVASLFAVGVLPFVWRRGKRSVVVVGAIGVVLVVGAVACWLLAERGGLFRPGDRSYFDSYEYVVGVDWSERSADDGDRVVAYEKESWWGERRVVAFRDGSVRVILEERFRELMEGAGEEGVER